MPDRSLAAVDDELSLAVKARASARQTIRALSDAVIENTRKIDQLLAERSDMVSAGTCPDSPAELLATEAPQEPVG